MSAAGGLALLWIAGYTTLATIAAGCGLVAGLIAAAVDDYDQRLSAMVAVLAPLIAVGAGAAVMTDATPPLLAFLLAGLTCLTTVIFVALQVLLGVSSPQPGRW